MNKKFKLQKSNKPFWKNIWFYVLVILITPIVITYVNNHISHKKFEKISNETQALIEKSQKTLAETNEWLKPKLELQSWNVKNEHGFTIAEGEVLNISNKKLENVEAVVSIYTEDDIFISSSSALIEYQALLPNQLSPFKVTMDHNPLMDHATITFKEFMGDTINVANKKETSQETNEPEKKDYSILKNWKEGAVGANGRKLTSTGFEILIDENLEESKIIEVVKELAAKGENIKINVFSSKKAFNDLHATDFQNTEDVKSGYIISFMKSPNGNTEGQITWMQEVGRFADKYGQKDTF